MGTLGRMSYIALSFAREPTDTPIVRGDVRVWCRSDSYRCVFKFKFCWLEASSVSDWCSFQTLPLLSWPHRISSKIRHNNFIERES